MKMAKASQEEIEATIDLVNDIENIERECRSHADSEEMEARIGRRVAIHQRHYSLGRVVFGYQILVDNCCDPNESALEWRPDIKAALEKAGIE